MNTVNVSSAEARDRQALEEGREYAQRVQARLQALLDRALEQAKGHDRSIQMIYRDAWEELRVKPTAISPEEMMQLATEIDRFTARRQLLGELGDRALRMLPNPFFGRVDFKADDEDALARIFIGLYAVTDESGALMVYDWRAPICTVYYDQLPGRVRYTAPDGEISGEMTLKRQYRFENGALRYCVDTGQSIGDTALLDVLGSATTGHMRQIVSSIQSEQNLAIRASGDRTLCVVGAAGSGKTGVALHRAAYLMYRGRDHLDATKLAILSPGSAFSEYISQVLPELGEANIRTLTADQIVRQALGTAAESPQDQADRLLESGAPIHHRSAAFKSDYEFLKSLERAADRFSKSGPPFETLHVGRRALLRAKELRALYTDQPERLSPAQRLERLSCTLSGRLDAEERRLEEEFRARFAGDTPPKKLAARARAAARGEVAPARARLEKLLRPDAHRLLAEVLSDAPSALLQALNENRSAGILWWEDAVAEAWLLVRLGYVRPDRTVSHLIIDEAQDYTEVMLSLLHLYYPAARVTILGDPCQRTTPDLPACDPGRWGAALGDAQATRIELNRCYRTTLPITRYCRALLPPGEAPDCVERAGAPVIEAAWSVETLRNTVELFRSEGHASIAVIVRTQRRAVWVASQLSNVYRLDGGDQDDAYANGDTVVAALHRVKGLEFDAVIVVWPEWAGSEDDAGERARLYTACTRALHRLAVLT